MIIEPSTSEWAAPVVLAKKKDGSLRICVDYRRINEVTQTDSYPIPRVDEIIDQLGKAKFITTLDLAWGYWQVPVAPEHRKKTAFVTSYGLYQFKRMPFGAPATFQRMMDQIVRELQPYTSVYIDDLVIFSETWEEHLEHLRVVLGRLQQVGLTIKLSKCQFGMDHCVYLGHVVGKGVVIPELSKVRVVEALAVPETKTEVRAFLGMTGYYRRFIANYAEIASPLTDLVKKATPNKVLWSDECNSAFNMLKKLLCSSPVLSSPDFSREFIVQMDASDRAVSAVLSQVNEIGEEHPVGYFSRSYCPGKSATQQSKRNVWR